MKYFEPDCFEHWKKVAQVLFESGVYAEKKWLRNPQAILITMQKACDMGLPPLVGLDNLIQWKQGGWMCSMNLTRGMIASAGGSAEIVEESENQVTIVFRRQNWPDHTETTTYSELERAGITTKETFNKYPRLIARANCLRRGAMLMFADKLAGLIPYDVEIEGIEDVVEQVADPAAVTAEQAKPKRKYVKKETVDVPALPVGDVNAADLVAMPGAEPAAVPEAAPQVEQVEAVADAQVEAVADAQGAPVGRPGFHWDEAKGQFLPDAPYDNGNPEHRKILVRVVPTLSLPPMVMSKVRKAWEAGWWKGRCVNSVESVTEALRACASEVDSAK
jgi:hypothetical protein